MLGSLIWAIQLRLWVLSAGNLYSSKQKYRLFKHLSSALAKICWHLIVFLLLWSFPSNTSMVDSVIWKRTTILTVAKMPSVIQTGMLILAPPGGPLSSPCAEWIQNKRGLLVRWNYLPKGVTDTKPPVRNCWYDRPAFKTFYYSTFLPFLCTHECKQFRLVSPIKLNNSAPLTHLPFAFRPCLLLSDSPFQKYLLIILC